MMGVPSLHIHRTWNARLNAELTTTDTMTMVHRAVRLFVGSIAMASVVASCGTAPVAVDSIRAATQEQPSVAPTSEIVAAPTWEPSVDDRPLYQGFGSLNAPVSARAETETLVALARKDIEVFTAPNRNEAQLTMPWTTILGTVTVLTVVDQPSTGWVEVMLPIRPNGSTGFVQTTDVEIYAVGGKILVDLSERELTYTLDGTEVISTTVAVGTPSNPTPTGTFFVTDNVTLANPNSPWGPHALGLSARSETITEYNGGDGIIGIHGTSNPSSIGQAASLGCVRLPNDLITLLHELVPIGTPVEIRA